MNCKNSTISFLDGKLQKKVVLVLLDGWGVEHPYEGNIISVADTPFFDSLIKSYPSARINAAAKAIGSRDGEQGSCVAGHFVMGTGRPLPFGDGAIDKGTDIRGLRKNEEISKLINHLKRNNSSLHLFAGLSESSLKYFSVLAGLFRDSGIVKLRFNFAIDKKGVVSSKEINSLLSFQKNLTKIGCGEIAAFWDKDFLFDIDGNWQKTEAVYNFLIGDTSCFQDFQSAFDYLRSSEDCGVRMLGEIPSEGIANGDAIFFAVNNYAAISQIAASLAFGDFDKFTRKEIKDLRVVSLVDHAQDLPISVIFPEEEVLDTLSDCLASLSLRQVKISDADKFGYLTFFFNGKKGRGKAEDWFIISSGDNPQDFGTENLESEAIKAIEKGAYDFVAVNFGGADTVSSYGDILAVQREVENIDNSLRRLVKSALDFDFTVIVTSDHGNIECFLDMKTGQIDRSRTLNPVPFLLISREYEGHNFGWGDAAGGDLNLTKIIGSLSDVAPTILHLMGIKTPKRMTGRSLI